MWDSSNGAVWRKHWVGQQSLSWVWKAFTRHPSVLKPLLLDVHCITHILSLFVNNWMRACMINIQCMFTLSCFLLVIVISSVVLSVHWCIHTLLNLVPRGHNPFGQQRGSWPLARSNTGSLWFTDFPSLCACPQSQVWQIWLVLVSIYCVYKAIQNLNVVGPGQGSWFPVHDKRDPWGWSCTLLSLSELLHPMTLESWSWVFLDLAFGIYFQRSPLSLSALNFNKPSMVYCRYM